MSKTTLTQTPEKEVERWAKWKKNKIPVYCIVTLTVSAPKHNLSGPIKNSECSMSSNDHPIDELQENVRRSSCTWIMLINRETYQFGTRLNWYSISGSTGFGIGWERLLNINSSLQTKKNLYKNQGKFYFISDLKKFVFLLQKKIVLLVEFVRRGGGGDGRCCCCGCDRGERGRGIGSGLV